MGDERRQLPTRHVANVEGCLALDVQREPVERRADPQLGDVGQFRRDNVRLAVDVSDASGRPSAKHLDLVGDGQQQGRSSLDQARAPRRWFGDLTEADEMAEQITDAGDP
jgi:hypothetical protein